MSSALDRVLERVRQNRAARAPERRSETGAGAARRGADVGAFVAGMRAFDTVSGEHVEVVGGTIENVVVSSLAR